MERAALGGWGGEGPDSGNNIGWHQLDIFFIVVSASNPSSYNLRGTLCCERVLSGLNEH